MSKKVSTSFKFFGEIVGVIISLVVLTYILPQLAFITDKYPLWLPVAITTTLINAPITLLKHLSSKPLSFLFESLSTIPSIYSITQLIQIYPIDFSLVGLSSLNLIFRFALNFTIFALIIALVINLIKFLTAVKE